MSRLLIVDSDAGVRALIQRFLTRAGYEVLEASDTDSAVQTYAAERPDAVMLSTRLAGQPIEPLCGTLKLLGPVPVVLLAEAGAYGEAELANLGVARLVALPLRAAEVLSALSGLTAVSAQPTPKPAPVAEPAAELGLPDEDDLDLSALSDESAPVEDEELRWEQAALTADPDTDETDELLGRFSLTPMSQTSPHDPCGIYGEITFPNLLFRCFQDLFSGRLLLKRGDQHKEIFLVGGRPVRARSTVLHETLSHLLWREGLITARQAQQCADLVLRDGISSVTALLKLGALHEDQVAAAQRRLVRERILKAFAWRGAEYGLTYEPGAVSVAPADEQNPLVLIFDGIKTAFPVAPLVSHFDEYMRRPVKLTDRMGDYATMLRDFGAELRVADLCDGQRTVAEVISGSGYGLIETLRILRALEVVSCLAFDAPREPDSLFTDPNLGARRATPSAGLRRSGPSTGGQPVFRFDKPSGAPVGGRPTAPRATPSQSGSGPLPSARAAGPISGAPSAAVQARPSLSNTGPIPGRTGTGGRLPFKPVSPTLPTGNETGEALVKLIDGRFAALADGTHYDFLGLPANATLAQIDRAKIIWASVLKKDRITAVGDPQLLERARQVAQRMAVACDTLLDPTKRQGYDALNLEVPIHQGGPDVGRAPENCAKGRVNLEADRAERALQFFDNAARQDPHQSLYRMLRGFARYAAAEPKDRAAKTAAFEEVKAALTEDESQDEGYVLLAHIYRATGQADLAGKLYRKALSLNARNKVALRALEALDGRAPTETGLLGRLFSR